MDPAGNGMDGGGFVAAAAAAVAASYHASVDVVSLLI